MMRSYDLSGSLANVRRASPMTASSCGWQLARKVKCFDFSAMSTTIGIDLEEAPRLVLARVAGERAGAEADDAETARLAVGVEARLHDLHRGGHRTARVVVGAGRHIGHDVAGEVAQALRAMQRRAVRQHVEVAAFRLADAIDAVVAALRVPALDGGRQHDDDGEHHQRRGELAGAVAPEGDGGEREDQRDHRRRAPFAERVAVLRGEERPLPDQQQPGSERGEDPHHVRLRRPRLIEDAGPAGERQRDEQRIFEHLGEDARGDEGGEQSAEHAAERHPQVELGEIARLRAVQVQRPMRDEGGEEERRNAGAGGEHPFVVLGLRQLQQREQHGGELCRQQQPHRQRQARLEGEHERRQVECERQHPEQRRRGDVGGDVRGEGGQQRRRHQRQAAPGDAAAPRRRIGIGGRRHGGCSVAVPRRAAARARSRRRWRRSARRTAAPSSGSAP